jgi:hypothetical protein
MIISLLSQTEQDTQQMNGFNINIKNVGIKISHFPYLTGCVNVYLRSVTPAPAMAKLIGLTVDFEVTNARFNSWKRLMHRPFP